MIRLSYAVPAMFCLAAAVVTAQQPTTPQPTMPPPAEQPTRPAEMSMMAGHKATYTGCVKSGTTTGTWILENAEVGQTAGAASSPGTVGTSGTAKTVFSLDPAATVNLKAHANHKVEVVGMLMPAKAGADAAAPSSTAAGAHAAHRQFSVESLKMVSATCP